MGILRAVTDPPGEEQEDDAHEIEEVNDRIDDLARRMRLLEDEVKLIKRGE